MTFHFDNDNEFLKHLGVEYLTVTSYKNKTFKKKKIKF